MQKVRVLVIDGSRIMRKMVIDALSRTGLAEFECIEAQDGVDALGKFDPEAVDLVLADWSMPRMSGLEFVHQVRGMRLGADTPIIMVTSEKTVGEMEIAMDKVGATGYVRKPFTALDLKRKLARVVAGLEARSAAATAQAKPGGFFKRLMDSLS